MRVVGRLLYTECSAQLPPIAFPSSGLEYVSRSSNFHEILSSARGRSLSDMVDTASARHGYLDHHPILFGWSTQSMGSFR